LRLPRRCLVEERVHAGRELAVVLKEEAVWPCMCPTSVITLGAGAHHTILRAESHATADLRRRRQSPAIWRAIMRSATGWRIRIKPCSARPRSARAPRRPCARAYIADR